MSGTWSPLRFAIAWGIGCLAVVTSLLVIPDPMAARAGAIASLCLVLWLTEVVPPFAPTLLLLATVPLLLAPYGPEHHLGAVLGWLADPVLALFLGGFTIGAAVSRHGLDRVIAITALRWSHGSAARLLLWSMLITAGLSMWMSNIAAMALMLAAMTPALASGSDSLRRALLVGIAMAANVGGMGTPIGSGPNAVAMGSSGSDVTFIRWMAVGVPAVVGALLVTWGLVRFLLLPKNERLSGDQQESPPITRDGWLVIGLVTLTIVGWVSEPWHGIPSPTIALALAAVFFCTRLLTAEDFLRLDWSTIALIGGGIALGRLIGHTGLVAWFAQALGTADLPLSIAVFVLVMVAAVLSAVMSNTATATLLIPLAAALDPSPPVLTVMVALACSFGLPFIISTPQNAMAVGAGARSSDLLRIGLPVMIIGCGVLVICRPLIALVFTA